MQAQNKISNIQIIGFASCIGAQNTHCDNGPRRLRQLNLVELLTEQNVVVTWDKDIVPTTESDAATETFHSIVDNCKELADQTCEALEKGHRFVVIGGDHSCAIGTWSGAYAANSNRGDIGVIWIDAHMDSHTYQTSPSGAVHGMPLACLLGSGEAQLTQIKSINPKFKPENICLVGIRSFETEEAKLLESYGVKIFYMSDIHQLGMDVVLNQALEIVSTNTVGYGISLDLDAIDPGDAPGVGSPEKGGISGNQLIKAIEKLNNFENFMGIEVTELNPDEDSVDKTAKLAIEVIKASFKVR